MHDETKVVEISEDQFTILQFKHSPSTTGQPTNLCISFICQGQAQHSEKMFATDRQSQ